MSKKGNKWYLRFVSIALVLSMVVTSLQVGCFSASAEGETLIEPQVESSAEEPYVLAEDTSRRKASEKHFLMSDGTSVAAVYETPVHYIDENGVFQEIDNSLESDKDEYRTKHGLQNVRISKNASEENLVTIQREDLNISWGLKGISKTCAVIESTDDELEKQKFTVKNLTSKVYYSEVLPQVDLEYLIAPVGVKENIILKSSTAQNQFNVRYDIGSLIARQINDQTVELLSGDKVVYEIMAPVMTDAKGALSDGVTLKIMGQENGHITVDISTDKDWLKDPSRSYPVTVDPMVMTKQDSATMVCKYITTNSYNLNATGSLYVGNQPSGMGVTYSAVKYNNLPTLSKGDMICGGYMYLEQRTFSTYGDTSQQINAHPITASWTGWSASTAGVVGNLPSNESNTSDYKIVTSSNNSTIISWDMTTTVKKWYRTGTNYGVLLRPQDSRKVLVQFASQFHTFAAHPFLTVNYINNKGLEDYWSYDEQDLGTSGMSYVNHYTGNLVVNIPIAETASVNLPVAISYYYNGYQAGRHYGAYRGGETYDPSRSVCGAGWKMNLDETISYLSDGVGNNDQLHDQGYDYVYTDADGTILYMKNISGNVYEDELGKGYTLSLVNSQWILTDKQNNKKVFNSAGRLIEIHSNQTKDKITLTYTNGYLSQVTDGGGQSITISRNAYNAVTSITSSLGTTTFGYSGSKLMSITYPDSKSITMTYLSDNNLSTINLRDGRSILYEYPTSGDSANKNRVLKVTERSELDNGVREDGNYTTFAYSDGNTTTVTDRQNRSVVYNFDQYGRTTSAIDDNGAVNVQYTSNSGTSNKNNKVTSSSDVTQPINNLLSNHSFENGLTGWSDWNADGITRASSNTTNAWIGSKSVAFTATSTVQNSTFYQQYTPTQTGNYTFSFYYKTAGLTGSGGLRPTVALVNSNGTTQYISGAYVKESTGNDWERLSVTVDVTSDITKIHGIIAYQNTYGTVYVDCAQLEYGAAANDYNLVENAFFQNNGTSWSTNMVSPDSFNTVSGSIYSNNRPSCINRAAFIKGNASTNKYLAQNIQVNVPANKAAFRFSGYACAYSVPNVSERFFALDLCFHYSDNTIEYVVVSFNVSSNTWQYASKTVLPKAANQSKHVSYVTVYFLYYKNLNWAAFSGMNLMLDKTGAAYSYDSNGNLVTAKDMAGREETATIDTANRLTGYKDAENSTYTYTYNTDNATLGTTQYQVQKAVDNHYSQRFEFSYDTHGNVTQTTKLNNNESTEHNYPTQTNSTYSASGDRIITTTDAMRNTTTYTYNQSDSNDQRVYKITQNGSEVSYSYKPYTGLVSEISAPVTRIDGQTQTVSNSYNYQNDRLTSITHNNFSYTLQYDKFGNRTNTLVAGQSLMSNTYDAANGLLTRSTYGNGKYVDYIYDSYDRITAKKYDGDQRFGYTYDANGRVYRHTDSVNNKTYTYTYDLLGRLQKTNVSDGSKIRYTYNNVNRNTGTAYTYSGLTKNFAYTYFKGGLSQTATYPNGASKSRTLNDQAQVNQSTVTTSSNNNWITNIDYYRPTVGTVQYNTDAVGSIEHSYSNNSHRTFSYTYDGSGNISSITDSKTGNDNSLTSTYEYDELNQLIRENNAYLNQTVTYTYDEGGNILTKTFYSYTPDSLDGRNGTEVSYNYSNTGWRDLLISYNGKEITYDAIGNPLNYYNGASFTWEAGRQLASATLPDETELSYKYNESGIRTRKTVNGENTDYFLDGTNIIAQKTGDDIIWFYYDGDGTREAIEYDGNVYYYFYNAQGDVMGLYDDDLNIVVAYTYDSWGKILSITGTHASDLGVNNPFRYRGYYYDTETGFYYLNSRYYDPEIGRFINADGYVSTGQGILDNNMFTYCGNNAINNIDPDGKSIIGIVGLGILCVGMILCLTASDNKTTNYVEQNKKDSLRKAGEKYNNNTVNVYVKGKGKLQEGKVNVELMPNHKNSKSNKLNPNILIHDSYKITNYYDQGAILDVVINNPNYDNRIYTRTKESYIAEWRWHNFAYQIGFMKERAMSVDLDEEGNSIKWDIIIP